jgi:hypothetical protein
MVPEAEARVNASSRRLRQMAKPLRTDGY